MILNYVESLISTIYIHDLFCELLESLNDLMMWPPLSFKRSL